ncbi:hypothetical protein Bbelb_406840 [Branchiostoma belcheri]|nr:hypothetical protein Bbelb_406840 [Branchiostoma belcheri]
MERNGRHWEREDFQFELECLGLGAINNDQSVRRDLNGVTCQVLARIELEISDLRNKSEHSSSSVSGYLLICKCNLARLKSRRHVLVKCIRELLYADDSALVAHTLDRIQRLLEKFAEAARAYGMTINIKKTEVLYQPAPGKPHIPPQVLLDGTPLAEAKTFTYMYLGSTVSNDNSMDVEIDARRRAASAAFGRLKDRLWNVSTLYARHVRQLSVLVQRHLRGLTGITWQDRISNVEVLRRAGMPAMEAMITRSQLRWTGHVIRMPEERLPRHLLFSELKEGIDMTTATKSRAVGLTLATGLAGSSSPTAARTHCMWRALTTLDKRIVFGTMNYTTRMGLAILDWNENVDREATSVYSRQTVANPRQRAGSKNLKAKTYRFVQEIQKSFLGTVRSRNGLPEPPRRHPAQEDD